MRFAWIAVLLLSYSSFAADKTTEQKVSATTIKKLVSDYYYSKSLNDLTSIPSPAKSLDECQPIPKKGECITAACSRMASYYCDETSEIREIALACANNLDGTCLLAFCARIPSYYCDDPSEVKEVARTCAGSVDGKCLQAVCNKMPSYYCDETSEVKAVTMECKGLLDADCISVVCSKLPSYYCDEFSELKEVIAMCKNP